jgi:hypothetical protein
MTELTRHTIANLTLQEATIAAEAIGRHRVDDRCTCVWEDTELLFCDQCREYFLADDPDAYAKAIKAETAKFWAEQVRDA